MIILFLLMKKYSRQYQESKVNYYQRFRANFNQFLRHSIHQSSYFNIFDHVDFHPSQRDEIKKLFELSQSIAKIQNKKFDKRIQPLVLYYSKTGHISNPNSQQLIFQKSQHYWHFQKQLKTISANID